MNNYSSRKEFNPAEINTNMPNRNTNKTPSKKVCGRRYPTTNLKRKLNVTPPSELLNIVDIAGLYIAGQIDFTLDNTPPKMRYLQNRKSPMIIKRDHYQNPNKSMRSTHNIGQPRSPGGNH